MTRTRRTVEISDALWSALELMSREMSVDRDSLVNQALFTFARFNGYVTPGSVAPHAQPAAPGPTATASGAVAQPLASPPSAVRREQAAPPAAEDVPPEAPTAPPRMATGSVPAVPPAQPPTPTPAPITEPAPTTDPQGPAITTGANTALAPAASLPGDAASTTAAEEAPAEEPPEDENLEDGLDALPENGDVEWKVPRFILADASIAVVKGTVKGRDFQGAVQLCDKAGAVKKTLQLGTAVEDERVESVLVHEVREPKAWKQLAQQLVKEQHVGEATLAMIRAVGAGEPAQTLTAWFAEHTIPRSDRASKERAQKAIYVLQNMERFGAAPPRKASYLTEELLQGAWAPALCRSLAIDQDQFASSRAAADFIRAAKALNPADKAYYAFTQALIEMSLGNPDASRVCADELRERSEEQATFLTTYLNGLFPEFTFWAGQDGATTLELDVEAKPSARKLADFRNAIQKTAVRVKTLREHLLALVPPETKWIPPSVDALLARGKVTLEEHEQLAIEEWQQKSIPQLLRFARNEWSRLTWLCWLAGLDAVGLPTATSKPRSPSVVHRAIGMRLHLLSLRDGETPLEEGFDAPDHEDARRVAEIAWCDTTPVEIDGANASELAIPEMNAVLSAIEWAADAEAPSPFAGSSADDEEEDEDEDDEAGDGEGEDAAGDEAADEADDEEADDEDEGDDDGDDAADDDADEAAGEDEEQPVPAPAPTPASPPARDSTHTAKEPAVAAPPEEPAADEAEPPADRTAIVRPSGRKLWVLRDGHDTLELQGMRFTVGRDPRCEIVIASPRVSREHAAVLVDADTVLVTDLNSSNGTFFNGERVMRHVVNDGDVVQFGNEKITFRFTDPS